MAKRKAAGTPALQLLQQSNVAHTPHPYEHADSTKTYGLEASTALGVSPEQLFKTLLAEVDGNLVVGIVPVAGTLDLKALAKAVGGKRATMADVSAAERATGYVVGGISPLGQRRRLPTVLDESAGAFATIYVSAGRRGLQVELAPDDLGRLTDATIAPIAATPYPSSAETSDIVDGWA